MCGAHCQRCGLSARHEAARLDEQQVCALCRRSPDPETLERRRQRARHKLHTVIETAKQGPGPHAVVAASGGKDSSYTIVRLRRDFGLDVVAVAVDNGYLSEAAEANLKAVCTPLDVPVVIARPAREDLKSLFAFAAREEPFPSSALQRASGICNACIALVKSICLREALERDTPLLAWGWSPGQAPLASAVHQPPAELMTAFEELRSGPLASTISPRTRSLLVDADTLGQRRMPTFVNPLAVETYDEAAIRRELEALGWRPPADTDANSTNCRLNALGNHLHRRRHGVNPYALELASLVREGWMERSEALQRLADREDVDTVIETARELGVDDLIDFDAR